MNKDISLNATKKIKYNLKDFTRDPFVYVGFSSDSEEDKSPDSTKNNKKINSILKNNKFLGNKRESTEQKDFGSNKSVEFCLEKNSSSIIIQKNVISEKNNYQVNNDPIKNNDISAKIKRIQSKSHDKIEKSALRIDKKITSKKVESEKKDENDLDIFNHDFDNDVIIEKKEEFKNKLIIEKFERNYEKFLSNKEMKLITETISKRKNYIFSNLSKLHSLFLFVKENGGIEEVVKLGLLDKFMRTSNVYSTIEEARTDFNIYLYHYSLYLDKNERPSKEEAEEICSKDPSMLLECPIIYALDTDSEKEINDKIQEGLKKNLVILRGFLPHFKLDNSIFSIDYVEKHHNMKNKIDVIEQASDFFGFTPNKHIREQWKIGDYIKYVRKKTEESKEKKVNKNNKNHKESKVYYGVNVELTDYLSLYEELERKVSPLMLFGSTYDSLAYVRHHIKGMTIPQMYIKVPHVWTGGHEENLRMRSINISHGPGDSIWWGTPTDDSKKFAKLVEQIYGINIYKKEGIWFPHHDFCLKNKLRVYYTLQQPGDIVLVGTGTLHWVKASSHSINTSWNFGSKDSASLKMSMDRYAINKEIKMRSLVPLMTLLLDMLNYEMFELNIDFAKTCYEYIYPEIIKSIEEFNKIKEEVTNKKKFDIGIFKEDETYLVENCENCYQEIFNSWAYCQSCSEDKTKQNINHYILCIPCFRLHIASCSKNNKFIFYKYEEEELRKFLRRLNFKIKYDNELTDYMQELKEVQISLIKKTKDFSDITMKKKNKIIITEDLLHQKLYYNLFKEYDPHIISSLLIPVIDADKLESYENRHPLKASKDNFMDPYIMFDDIVENINLKRFSPIRVFKEEIDINDNFSVSHLNNLAPISNFTFHNDAVDVNQTINKSKNYLGFSNNTYNTYNINNTSSIKTGAINFHATLPGKSLASSNIINFNFNQSNNSNFNNFEEQSIHSIKGSNVEILNDNFQKNLNPIHSLLGMTSLSNLKNNLNVRDSINVYSNITNNQPFIKIDVSQPEFVNLESQSNPFNYNYTPYEIQKRNAIDEIKKALVFLRNLVDREKCTQYKFESDTHRDVWEGKKLILKHLDNQEVIQETKLKTFVERIVNNENLILPYRTMFREEIYYKIK